MNPEPGDWIARQPCIAHAHYPMPEPPTPLTADLRLHDYDAMSPCEYVGVGPAIVELAVICEAGHATWAWLAGVDDVAHCAAAHCRRVAWAMDGAGSALVDLYERQHAAAVVRIWAFYEATGEDLRRGGAERTVADLFAERITT